jgi:hypothetical protein
LGRGSGRHRCGGVLRRSRRFRDRPGITQPIRERRHHPPDRLRHRARPGQRAGDQAHRDPFAYSVELAAAPGVDQVLVEIVRFEGGVETVVQEPDEQGIVASSRIIAFTVPTTRLLDAWGPGSYEMRIYLADPDPVARGHFTLVETPTAS